MSVAAFTLLQMVCEFSTVQDFWRYFEHVPKPSKVFSEFDKGTRYTASTHALRVHMQPSYASRIMCVVYMLPYCAWCTWSGSHALMQGDAHHLTFVSLAVPHIMRQASCSWLLHS